MVITVHLLSDNVLEVLHIGEGAVKRDGGRLDGDTTFLLVGTSVCGSGLTSFTGGDNTGFREERVGQGRFAVINVGNDGHIAHVSGLVCTWC